MTDITPEQVLAQIRFAVGYQKDRFPPSAEIIDLMAALKAGIAAGGPHGE